MDFLLDGKKIRGLSGLMAISGIVTKNIVVICSCHCHCCPWGILLHRGRVNGFEPIVEGSNSLRDLASKSGKIHQLTIVMVRAGSTIIVHWVFYAQAYVLTRITQV